jgi:hypothetical protein
LELAGEEDAVGELVAGDGGELHDLAGYVVADGGEGGGAIAVGAGPGGVAFGLRELSALAIAKAISGSMPLACAAARILSESSWAMVRGPGE